MALRWNRELLQNPQVQYRFGIVVAAIGFLLFDLYVKPLSAVDVALIAVIAIALLPWIEGLPRMLKSAEIPGWLKLEFQEDLKSATEEAEQAGLLSEPNSDEKNQPIYELIYNQDPRLSLAGLRIALEGRLRELAKLAGVPVTGGRTLESVVWELNSAQILTEDQADALSEIIPLLNRAVHSEDFNQAMADWAINIGPKLIAGLEQKALKAGGTRDRLWGNTGLTSSREDA